MGKAKIESKKSSTIPIILVIILTVSGIFSYFLIYEPFFENERERLVTFTTDLEPEYMDPAWAFDTDSFSILMNLYDRLVQYKKNSTEVEPSLATSWENPDPRTYIFNLREDVKFHDDTQFNATAVKFSIERVIELDERAIASGYIFFGIENIEVLDTYRIKFTLFEDFVPFLQVMAHPAASIVSPSAVAKYGETFLDNPVGTGPFKFKEKSNDEIVLIANNEYFKGSPKFEKVVFIRILEASDREEELLNGNIDAVFTSPPGVPVEDLDSLDLNPDVKVTSGVSADVEFLGMNGLISPFDDLKVREAIAYALDYEEIINDVLQGKASRLGGPVPPGIFGYTDITPIDRDINKAKQLLTEAGYPDGFETSITYNIDNLGRRKIAEVVRDNLAEIGIDVSIVGLDWDSLLDSYFAMEYEMTINKWAPDYFDADSYLFSQFHTISQFEGYNIFGFSDPQVDELIDQARSTFDASIRLQAYKEAQELIAEQYPVVFLYVPEIHDIVLFNIEGWEFSPTGYAYIYGLYRK